jgi:isopentenyldiphosphate isomerase
MSVSAEEEEYFDILDEHGQETGRKELRSIVHGTGLYHRAVYCFVLNPEGLLLIQVNVPSCNE